MRTRPQSTRAGQPALVWNLLCAITLLAAAAGAPGATNVIVELSKPIDEMSIEELVNIQVNIGTLAGSDLRRVPAAVTTIDSSDIRNSGARNLNELLEIFVPNLLYLRHNWEASHVGFRGVVGDIDNKYLLLVNGKVMNHHTHAGAISERDLALLGDIREIRVIRGPGSAVYGAGALLGVIDIRTFDGTTFQGTEITGRGGLVEKFYSAEIKHGFRLTEKAHLFLYAGVSDLLGADEGSAPYIMALSGSTFDGTPIVAGERYPVRLREDRRSYRALPPMKLHSELTIGDLSVWARYTRGGEIQDLEQRWLIQWPLGFAYDEPLSFIDHAIGYQQISAGADYKRQLNESWELAFRLGYHLHDFERQEFDVLLDANREDIYTARALATWNSSAAHSLTFGVEYLHGEFGLDSLGHPQRPAFSSAFPADMPRWSTDTYSALAEDQWAINSRWHLFTGFRLDKNDYTEYMFSPRAALVHTPTDRDTVKLILSQAVKANVAEELRWQHQQTGREGDTETLRAAELAYSRVIGENFLVGANGFFNNFEIIGWDGRTRAVGEADIAGLELEATYHTPTLRIGASHSYSRLIDFRNGTPGQFITAQPYGYGDDLNHWSSHITKLHCTYQPIDQLRFFAALRVFWGWPGWKDFTDYENFLHESFDPGGVDDPGTYLRAANYNPYDDIQARLNVGMTYDITPDITAGVHGYNLLGLFDGHLNDRFIMFSSSARRDAPAVAFTLSCRF